MFEVGCQVEVDLRSGREGGRWLGEVVEVEADGSVVVRCVAPSEDGTVLRGDMGRVDASGLRRVVDHDHVWEEVVGAAPERKVCTVEGCGAAWDYTLYSEPGGCDVRMRTGAFGTERARVIDRGPFRRDVATEAGEWETVEFEDGVTVLWVARRGGRTVYEVPFTFDASQVVGPWEPEVLWLRPRPSGGLVLWDVVRADGSVCAELLESEESARGWADLEGYLVGDEPAPGLAAAKRFAGRVVELVEDMGGAESVTRRLLSGWVPDVPGLCWRVGSGAGGPREAMADAERDWLVRVDPGLGDAAVAVGEFVAAIDDEEME